MLLNPTSHNHAILSDNLGNACLTSFFVTGAWDHDKLRQSLKAYQNAVSVQSKHFPRNPFDWFLNCIEFLGIHFYIGIM